MEQQIKTFLSQKFITVPDEWIPACIEFIKAEHGNIPNIGNVTWLREKVFEQWLHADLTDLGNSCLPFNLPKQESTIIKGPFVVQVNQIRDIGLPAYSQLQKLRKDDVQNASVSADKSYSAAWEPKPSRMLLLQLTDGTSMVQGMEYKTIQCLSLGMKPGVKILLKGTMEARKGMLLLTNEHVSILGGEVESLLVSNAPENIMRRALRLDDSEAPISVPESFAPNVSVAGDASQYYNTQSTQNSSFNANANKKRSHPVSSGRPSSSLNSSSMDQFGDDLDDFMDMETEMALIEAEQKASAAFMARRTQVVQPQLQGSSQIGQKSFPNSTPNKNSSNVSTWASSGYATNTERSSRNGFATTVSSNSSQINGLDAQLFFEDDDDDLLLAAAAEVPVDHSSFPITSTQKSQTSVPSYPLFQPRNSFAKPKPVVPQPSQPPPTNPFNNKINGSFPTNQFKRPMETSPFNTVEQSSRKTAFVPPIREQKREIVRPLSTLKRKFESNLTSRQTKLSNFVFEKKVRGKDGSFGTKEDVHSSSSRVISLEERIGGSPPYQYICYMDLRPIGKTDYTLKGFVTTLMSKLEQRDGKWSLTAKINDGTGSCDVDISDTVLRNLIGKSVAEFAAEKEQALSNPQLKASLARRICECQMQLIGMCCLLQIEVGPLLPRPKLVGVSRVKEVHWQQLKSRAAALLAPELS